MSPRSVYSATKPESTPPRTAVSAIVTGFVTAVLLLAFATYQHAPDKARRALWVPSMIVHAILVRCPENPRLPPNECPSKIPANLAVLFGSFFVFYFMVGAGIGAAVVAVRRRIRNDRV
jgi:hypothetical protein